MYALTVRAHVVVAFLLLFVGELPAAPAAKSVIVQGVMARIEHKVPDPALPVYRQFAEKTVSMLGTEDLARETDQEMVIRSIVQVALDQQQRGPTGDVRKLETALATFLDRYKSNLKSVTPDVLHRDWPKVRRDVAHDTDAVARVMKSVLTGRPVLVLDAKLNYGVALKADSLLGLAYPPIDPQRVSFNLPPDEVSRRAEKLVFEYVDNAVREQIGKGADYVDSIYLMAEMHYSGPFDPEDRALKQVIESTFSVEKTLVLPDLNAVDHLLFAVREKIFLGKELPQAHAGGLVQAIRTAFAQLQAVSIPISKGSSFPATFGGLVPDDIHYGAKFGIGNPSVPDQQGDIWKKIETEQVVSFWLSCVERKVSLKDALAGNLLASFADGWKAKALSRPEFGGSMASREIALSPAESRLLELFRKEWQGNPLFTDKTKPRATRIREFENQFFARPLEKPYQEAVAEIQAWLDDQYQKSVTPAMAQAQALKVRFYRLLSFLLADIRDASNLPVESQEYATLRSRVDQTSKRFDALGLFQSGKALSPDKLGNWPPFEKAAYEYYVQARMRNPVFQNLDQDLEVQQLWERYLSYAENGRPEEEQRKYDLARATLLAGVDLPPSPAPSPPAIQFPPPPSNHVKESLVLANVVILLFVGGVFLIRHLRKRSQEAQ